MAKTPIIKAEENLAALKKTTDNKIWQYVILKEFIDLFGQDKRVLNFVATNYGTSFYGLIDDSISMTKEELELYAKNQEITLEEKLQQVLEMS